MKSFPLFIALLITCASMTALAEQASPPRFKHSPPKKVPGELYLFVEKSPEYTKRGESPYVARGQFTMAAVASSMHGGPQGPVCGTSSSVVALAFSEFVPSYALVDVSADGRSPEFQYMPTAYYRSARTLWYCLQLPAGMNSVEVVRRLETAAIKNELEFLLAPGTEAQFFRQIVDPTPVKWVTLQDLRTKPSLSKNPRVDWMPVADYLNQSDVNDSAHAWEAGACRIYTEYVETRARRYEGFLFEDLDGDISIVPAGYPGQSRLNFETLCARSTSPSDHRRLQLVFGSEAACKRISRYRVPRYPNITFEHCRRSFDFPLTSFSR